VVRPSEALVEGAGRRTAVPYEPNDVRAHNLRVVSLRHCTEGMSSALMFRRHHAQRGITDVGVDVGDRIRRYHDGEMRTQASRAEYKMHCSVTCPVRISRLVSSRPSRYSGGVA
jgi:hypothetical protein